MVNGRKKDSLSRIVREAIKKEKKVNSHHPERGGYGFIGNEADEYIKRIERLEHNLERAQQAKILRRLERVSLMSNDKTYSHSPEEVYIEKEKQDEIKGNINKAQKDFPKRERNILSLYHGERCTQQEIAQELSISQSTVSRAIKSESDKFSEALVAEVSNDNRSTASIPTHEEGTGLSSVDRTEGL